MAAIELLGTPGYTSGMPTPVLITCSANEAKNCRGSHAVSCRSIFKNFAKNNGVYVCTRCSARRQVLADSPSKKNAVFDLELNERIKALNIIDEDISELSKGSSQIVTVNCRHKLVPECRGATQYAYDQVVRLITKGSEFTYKCLPCTLRADFYGRRAPGTKYIFDDDYFTEIDSEAKAYLLGWIASDGHIRRGGFTIELHRKDKACLEMLRDLISKDIPIYDPTNRPGKPTSVLQVNSRKMSEDLSKHFKLPFARDSKSWRKSDILQYPDLDPKYDTAFIRGFFDGDGCISFHGEYNQLRAVFISISSDFLQSIRDKLDLGGSFSQNLPQLVYTSKRAYDVCKRLYTNTGGLHLQRKYDRYILHCSRKPKSHI